jgi:hypothetical protein
MDHVVYLDAAAKELDKLLSGQKTMIIRGAAGRKIPYGRVNQGDVLFFINNNAEGTVRGKAVVTTVFLSEAMNADQSQKLIADNQVHLQLSEKQIKKWGGKRYLVLVEVAQMEELPPFGIDKSKFGNMDDWLLVEDIKKVMTGCR